MHLYTRTTLLIVLAALPALYAQPPVLNAEELLLTPADTEAVLTGKTFSGQLIQGSDSVRVLP